MLNEHILIPDEVSDRLIQYEFSEAFRIGLGEDDPAHEYIPSVEDIYFDDWRKITDLYDADILQDHLFREEFYKITEKDIKDAEGGGTIDIELYNRDQQIYFANEVEENEIHTELMSIERQIFLEDYIPYYIECIHDSDEEYGDDIDGDFNVFQEEHYEAAFFEDLFHSSVNISWKELRYDQSIGEYLYNKDDKKFKHINKILIDFFGKSSFLEGERNLATSYRNLTSCRDVSNDYFYIYKEQKIFTKDYQLRFFLSLQKNVSVQNNFIFVDEALCRFREKDKNCIYTKQSIPNYSNIKRNKPYFGEYF